MEQIRMAHEVSTDDAQDIAAVESSRNGIKDLRTLNDLEMVWVGGGDGAAIWP